MKANTDRVRCWRCANFVEIGDGYNMRVSEWQCPKGAYRGGGWATSHNGHFTGLSVFVCEPGKGLKG